MLKSTRAFGPLLPACHKKEKFTDAVTHAPVKERNTLNATDAHSSDTDGFLFKEDDLCYGCHAAKKSEYDKVTRHYMVRNGKCSACHNPHASAEPKLVSGKQGETLS